MLINGTKLEYGKRGPDGEIEYVKLMGLKKTPDIGAEPEKVENTDLDAKNKQYENGVGDLGDMKYEFKYDNTSPDSPYRILRGMDESGEIVPFRETLPDGSVTEYEAQVSVIRTGGALNGVVESIATMSVQSDFKYTDPA